MVIQRAQKDDIVLEILQDENPSNPRRDFDGNIGTMLCWHTRYDLGDKNPYRNAKEALVSILTEHCHEELVKLANELFKIEETENGWVVLEAEEVGGEFHPWEGYDPFETKEEAEEMLQEAKDNFVDDPNLKAVQPLLHEKFVILSLYLIDHSGISINTSGFSYCDPQGYDWGVVGFIYAPKEKLTKETGYTVNELFSKNSRRWPSVGEHIKVKGYEDRGWGLITDWDGATFTIDFDWNKSPHHKDPANIITITDPLAHIAETMANRAEEILEAEVRLYDQYLQGDVYGFVLKRIETCEHCGHQNEVVIDSCWGFWGLDWKENGMIDYVAEEYHHLFDKLEYVL